MKVEKITDTYFNEFDGKAQGCSDSCTEYRGKTSGDYTLLLRAGFKGDGSVSDARAAIEAGYTYCYKDKTPKGNIYW